MAKTGWKRELGTSKRKQGIVTPKKNGKVRELTWWEKFKRWWLW